MSSRPRFTSPLMKAFLSAPVGASSSLADGSLSFHSTLPVFLSTAMKLGAAGEGMLMCPSSTPLLVTRNSRSPTMRGEEVDRLCGKTSSSFIMSSCQRILPSVVEQTTAQRLLTYQSRLLSTTGEEQM